MTESDSLRIGIAGTGSIGRKAHIPAWQRVPDTTLVAIADPDPEARAAANRRLGERGMTPVTEYASTEAMLAEEDLDVVDVTVRPEDGKAAVIRTALDANCHVTCQKPFVEEYSTAVELVEYADRCDRLLSVNQQARFAGAFFGAHDIIDDGALGALRTIRLQSDFAFAGAKRRFGFSSHSFDLVRYWADQSPERILAWHKRQTETDQYLFAVWIDFEGDLAAMIWDELTSSTTLRWQFRIMGAEGSVRGHEAYFDDMFPSEIAYTPASETVETVEPIGTPYVPDAFADYFTAFSSAVRNGTTPPASGRDNLETLRLAFAASEAARRGEWVDLDGFNPASVTL